MMYIEYSSIEWCIYMHHRSDSSSELDQVDAGRQYEAHLIVPDMCVLHLQLGRQKEDLQNMCVQSCCLRSAIALQHISSQLEHACSIFNLHSSYSIHWHGFCNVHLT